MNTKLTLRMDDDVIRGAKVYAEKSGQSVSRLVENYLRVLGRDARTPGKELTPRVASLLGSLKGSAVSEADYYEYLEKKYQ
ncbi:MAG: DUF6364 family protein [Coriobacteriia bacterium]